MDHRSLQTVLEHAEHQRDQGRTALREAESAVERLLQQADQLQVYRQETHAKHPAQGGRTATIELVRYHQAFVQRLEQAITQQAATLAQAQHRLAARRAELLQLETRVASVRKLMERRDTQERLRAATQEQKRLDEAARRRGGLETASVNTWRSTTTTAPF